MKNISCEGNQIGMRGVFWQFLPIALFLLLSAFPVQAQISLDIGGVNGGGVRIGTSSTTCAAGIAGGVRYNATSKCLELCNGTNWACISVAACGDATPNAFNFTDLVNQTTASLVTSNILQISGISCVVNVAISGEGSPQFRVCQNASCGTVLIDWTDNGTIDNNQYLQLRLTTSAVGGDTHSTTVSVGTNANVWNATPEGDCAASPIPGTVCADGTVYAGISVDGNVPMYVTRCDAGMIWNGVTCSGTRQSFPWNNGENNYVTTGTTSPVTGANNTAILVSLDANSSMPGHQNHAPATYCTNLSEGGHTDWYLPAYNELTVLFSNRDVIGRFASSSIYWSSSENSNTRAQARNFNTGNFIDVFKDSMNPIRCTRK